MALVSFNYLHLLYEPNTNVGPWEYLGMGRVRAVWRKLVKWNEVFIYVLERKELLEQQGNGLRIAGLHVAEAQSCPTVTYCPWGFSGKNTGVGCHFPPPGDLPNSGIESTSPASPALQADSLAVEPPGKPRGLQAYSLTSLIAPRGTRWEEWGIQIYIISASHIYTTLVGHFYKHWIAILLLGENVRLLTWFSSVLRFSLIHMYAYFSVMHSSTH